MKYLFIFLFFLITSYTLDASNTICNISENTIAAVERPPVTKKKKTTNKKQCQAAVHQAKKAARKAKRQAKRNKKYQQQTTRFNQKLKVGFIMYGIVLFFILAIFLVLSIWSSPLGLGGVIIGLLLGIITTSVLGIIGLVYTIMGLNELPQTDMGLQALGTTSAVVILFALGAIFWGIFANPLVVIVGGLILGFATLGLWLSIKNR